MSNRPVVPQAAAAGSARDGGAIAALEHYPSTSSADESIGEPIAPLLLRTLSNEATSPLSTGRSQVPLADASIALFCCIAASDAIVQEFFSARDEPEPEFVQEAGQSAKSPNPKYPPSATHVSLFMQSQVRVSRVLCMFKKREPPMLMPSHFAHLFSKIRFGRMEQVKVRAARLSREYFTRHSE